MDLWLYEGRLNRQNLRSLDREKSFWADGRTDADAGSKADPGPNSAVVIFRLEIESHNYAAAATSHFAARCAGNGCN